MLELATLWYVSINEYFLNKLGNSGHSGSRWLLFCGILLTTKPSYLAVQCSSTNDFETEMTVESGHSILKSTKGLRPTTFLQLFPGSFGLGSSHVFMSP